MKIAAATLNQTPIDWQNNLANIRDVLAEAQQQQAKLLCLPELCITGYGCEDLFLSDWLWQTAFQKVLSLLPYTSGLLVNFGVPLYKDGAMYNCAIVVRDEEIIGIVPKQFLANDGVHYEPRWFTPWTPLKVDKFEFEGKTYPFGDLLFQLDEFKIGFEICEDAWRSDTRPAHRHKPRQVNMILNPSASHFAFEKTKIREKLVMDSSENFDCTYVYANLLGNEAGRMIYDGEVMMAREGKLFVKNELLQMTPYQLLTWETQENEPLPIRDISKEEEFTKAGSLALFDYLRKSRSKGFVLSLSGGADSSTCALLVSQMIRSGIAQLSIPDFIQRAGLEPLFSEMPKSDQEIAQKILTTAYQGTENSSKSTLESAQKLAEDIGATFYEWKIDEQVKGYTQEIERQLQRPLTWEQDDITLQNIQARARSPIIWMLANIHNALLLTTSNRSEGDVGYTTMDGDTSGSIAPIAAVDKYFILQWLRWAEKELDYPSLSYVNSLQPTAELRPLEKTQTDEDDLMPYKVMVAIERLAIGQHRSPLEVFRALKSQELEEDTLLKQHIVKFYTLWSRNQWKRERIAPAFHLDDFNVDPRTWCRFPILSGSFKEELQKLDSES